MENTNTRNIILTILALMIVIGGVVYFNSSDTNKVETVVEDRIEVIEVKEFGEIDSFVRADLTDERKEDLKIILEQRKDRQVQIKDILDKAYADGDMEEAWIEVQNIRDKCKERILPFISESQIENFEKFCAEGGEKIEADYVLK